MDMYPIALEEEYANTEVAVIHKEQRKYISNYENNN